MGRSDKKKPKREKKAKEQKLKPEKVKTEKVKLKDLTKDGKKSKSIKTKSKISSKHLSELTLAILVEQAHGFMLVTVDRIDYLSIGTKDFYSLVKDASKFKSVAKVVAIYSFKHAQEALECALAMKEGEVPKALKKFLKGQATPYKLGIVDSSLARNVKSLGFEVDHSKQVLELHRAIRQQCIKILKGFDTSKLTKFQVGLGHSIARQKIAEDPNRQDKPIMNSITLLDDIDKSMNLFSMRNREWYCWHFPELNKIVSDHQQFARVVKVVGNKAKFVERCHSDGDSCLAEVSAALDNNEELAEEVIAAAKNSMGQEITKVDMKNLDSLSGIVGMMNSTRSELNTYLGDKLDVVAPNLKTLVGEVLAARLICHSGSLMNLAKVPASTIQILGAEKALFRALKTRGRTPKFGLLFNASAISRAQGRNKGRISRFLANKCALACRLDAFGSDRTNKWGVSLSNQVEERLNHLAEVSIKM